ncbi:hypothetical protein [Millisia brevis]|uniref:hypothetical protein n=1 Tax=Millisia brevis TaxID=264148 RepID=UPI00082EE484|nr:hypothetical protein [Millisia brevis]
MSDFTDKIKAEAKVVSAVIDQELTVLEGVDGVDPLAPADESTDEDSADSADTAGDDAPSS